MIKQNTTVDELKQLLLQTPVMGEVHPLVPVCLDPDILVIRNGHSVRSLIDTLDISTGHPILLLGNEPSLAQRFRQVTVHEHPPVDTVNKRLSHHLEYIRSNLLTTHRVADRIQADVAYHRYPLVVCLLIDGLSYGDVLDWKFDTTPCFVDGPSVTFQTDLADQLIPSIGFASIINDPPIGQRLYRLGYHNAVGYTYWHARSNLLAGYMFRGIPDNQVINFESILTLFAGQTIPPNTYIQIVREGLDGLAHSKRELRIEEIQSANRAILDDIHRLIEVIRTKSQSAVLYVISDHGLLWKNEHSWIIHDEESSKPRSSRSRPQGPLEDHAVRFECHLQHYYLYKYPYLGRAIRRNDSGVHGGLSYQESFVPFIKIEV